MNIKDIKGYDEFKKHCNFELCTKRYPDWIGSEKYIVITDDAEKDLLEAFPEIMKELSPYVIVGRYFAKMNDDMRYDRLTETLEELKRIEAGSGVDPDLLEIIQTITQIVDNLYIK